MAEFITKIRTENGDKQIDYNALANISANVKYIEDDNAVSGSLPEVTISQVDGLREELDAIDTKINNLGTDNTDSEIFIVTIDASTMTASNSASEIGAAKTAGKIVYALITQSGGILQLFSYSEGNESLGVPNKAFFTDSAFVAEDGSTADMLYMCIADDKTVTYEQRSLTGVPSGGTAGQVLTMGKSGNAEWTYALSGESGSRLGGTAVFFGDSICEGYNNNSVSYVDFISQMGVFDTVIKHGVAGAGYSQYNGYLPYTSLEDMLITYANEVRNADYVFVQYGNNDGRLVQAGTFPSSATICSKAKNCLDTIMSLNPNAKVFFVILFRDPMNIVQFSSEASYDMLKTAKEAAEFVASSSNIPIISMYDGSGITPDSFDSFMSSDGMHPNDAGHQRIATMIIKGINNPQNTCTYSYDVTYTEGDDLKNSISTLNKLMECGERVYLRYLYNGGYIKLPCVFHSSNYIQFSICTYSTTGKPTILAFVVSSTGTTMYNNNLTTT